MKTKCPLPKGFSGTKRVSGLLVALLVLALVTASGASAAPFAYISNAESNSVTVIDGTTVLTSPTPPSGIPVGAQPFGVAVNRAGTRAYVANSNMFETGVPSVSVIDTASLSVMATITTGISGNPTGVAVNDDGSLVYVANTNGTVAVIDAATNTVVNTLRPPPGQPRNLASVVVVADGSVWATDVFTGEVLNVTDNTVPGLFVSFGMMGIAADPSGARLYVSYGESADGNLKIAIIDIPSSFTMQTFTKVQISTTGMDSGANPGGIAVSPSGAFVYAAVLSENKLAVMDTSVTYTSTNRVPLIPVGPAPFGVAVDRMGTRVYVGISGTGTVTVLDAATNTVLQTGVPVGVNPMVFGSFVASERTPPPPPQFVLSLSTAGSGSGSIGAVPAPMAGGTYNAGTAVTLTAMPDANSVFAGWSGACSGSAASCTVTMNATKSVTATFTAQYTLHLTSLGNGTIGTQPLPNAGKYLAGTNVTLTAMPGSDSLFTVWSGACSGSSVTCTVLMNATKSVTATFTLKQYTLTVSTAGNGSGTVSPSGGSYNHGTVVSLTATPAAGSQFSSWSGCSGSGNTCSVTMDAAKSVTATFTVTAPPPPAQFTLTLDTVGSGSVAAQPPAPVAASSSIAARPLAISGKYNAGTVVEVTATAASGFKFTGWSGSCTGTGVCRLTMNADKSVTASFTVTPPPTACEDKIKDLVKKVAAHKHPWWHDHQLKISLKMYSVASAELDKAKAKVGASDKRVVRAQNEFDSGKAALCAGRYWRADSEFWDAYQIAHQILKQYRR